MDGNNLVTGLALDFCPVFLLPDSFWDSFRDIRFLSLKHSYLWDYSFIKDLKGLTSLDLSNNNLIWMNIIKDTTEEIVWTHSSIYCLKGWS